MKDLAIPTPDDIEKAADGVGLTIAALCRRADVAAELFYRWRSGGGITARTLQKLLDAAEQEKRVRKEKGN